MRLITLRSEAQYKALQAARQQAATDDYKADYARLSGINRSSTKFLSKH